MILEKKKEGVYLKRLSHSFIKAYPQLFPDSLKSTKPLGAERGEEIELAYPHGDNWIPGKSKEAGPVSIHLARQERAGKPPGAWRTAPWHEDSQNILG